MKMKFWCLLQLILKCTRAGPKATEGGRAGQIRFVYGARMATDKQSVPWDFSVDRPTVFSAAPEALRCHSLSPREAH